MHAMFYFYRTRNRKTAKHPILEKQHFSENPDFFDGYAVAMAIPVCAFHQGRAAGSMARRAGSRIYSK